MIYKRGEFRKHLILIVDEMYLRKATQYQGREFVGADEQGKLYKGIVAFIVIGLIQSVPYVIKAIPEVTFRGDWLAE